MLAAAGIVLGVAGILCPAASAEQLPRSVLFLDQFEVASPFSAAIYAKFRSTLDAHSPQPVSTYVENMDFGRFGSPQFETALEAFFREKYRDKPVGVVVALGSAALDLTMHLRPALWPDAPIIFAAVDEHALDGVELPTNVTGTTTRLNLADSVAVARAVVPGLKRIAIVGDPPDRKYIRRRVAAQLESLASEVEVLDLTNLSMKHLKTRVASLPIDSAIIYIGLVLDADHVAYTSHNAVLSIAQAANRPIIVQAETQLGTGVAGGIVASPTSIGEETARIALRVLAGESASNIPVTASAMTPIFDWRELQRWNVSADRLPSGSEVRFREPGIWDQHRVQIVAAIAAVLLQTALIVWLLLEHRRRHVAEITARNAMSELYQMNRLATAGELSASIAHEVSQPLMGIVTSAAAASRWLTAKTLDVDKARTALAQISRAAYRASEVIAGVRGMFQRDTEGTVPVDMNRLILTVLKIVRIDLERRGIEVEKLLAQSLPYVIGNPIQLQQVILNLAMNAIEAMHSEQTRVLRIKSELTQDDRVHVSIEDTGPGIDPSNLGRIFKPLFTTKAGGMGMGLSICRSIIEGHGGQIWVSAGSQAGSIFQFELPTRTHGS